MSEPSGWQAVKTPGREVPGDGEVVDDLLCWGHLLEATTVGVAPLVPLDDLLLSLAPERGESPALTDLGREFGKGSPGEPFLLWWLGRVADLPSPAEFTKGFVTQQTVAAAGDRLALLDRAAEVAFRNFSQGWSLSVDRLARHDGPSSEDYRLDIDAEVWERVSPRLRRPPPSSQPSSTLDHAIARVRSFFEPLESPLFGMNPELLAHHVRETIPREVPGDIVTPIVPIFGNAHRSSHFSTAGQLPIHLRVILRRLERSQAQDEVVTGLLASLEAVDFTLRMATGLAQGCWAAVSETEFAGAFAPSTGELISDLSRAARQLRSYWDHPQAQPAIHLLYRGQEFHPFLQWAGLEAQPRLLAWMMEAEAAIREDNPARCSALAHELSEPFLAWLGEFVLLCSAWDMTIHTRADGYLGISMARGSVGIHLKPLVDPTRYSVWLDRSELAAVGGRLEVERAKPAARLEPLDSRIFLVSNDPPLLSEAIAGLLKAHEQGQVLPLGRSLFQGLEYLVRLHASLAGGFLRHQFEETSLLDPVLKPGGSLQHTIYFLCYAQRVLGDLEYPEAALLRSVFFAEGGQPRRITRWLGVDEGVPGPLQGLIGWNLSLMRPDAPNRLDEIRDQIPHFSRLFAELCEASRQLWSRARLRTEPGAEGAQATVCQFPSGLRVRGVPDIMVGRRGDEVPSGVVVGGAESEDRFSHWDSEELLLEGSSVRADSFEERADESRESPPSQESSWPSFFDDNVTPASRWSEELKTELEVRCRELDFAGSEHRPLDLAGKLADFVTGAAPGTSSLSLVRGERGSGRTLLCRTLVHPACSPLPADFPVLYLRVDRFPETRLSTVVERLNDHIASEPSMQRLDWLPVPTETLQSLGSEVDRLSNELAELGQYAEPLSCRLSSYLRCLKKVNGGRDFLLLLDGFETVPDSIVPRVLTPGVHLLITGSEFPQRGETSPYLQQQFWDLSHEVTSRAAFAAQLAGTEDDPVRQQAVFQRFHGSLLKARAYANLVENQEGYTPTPSVLEDLLVLARRLFPGKVQREALGELLCVLGLYERPVPLRVLEGLGIDPEVANEVTSSLPSLFSFWSEPEAALGLAHRSLFDMLLDSSSLGEAMAERLAREFLHQPRRGDLMPALRWLSYSSVPAELVEQLFASPEAIGLWREELAKLWKEGLYFQRVALLDATEEPLRAAIEAGAGHLREELGWLHNARGLSLMKLGLLEEAAGDLETALDQFQIQFAAGEMTMISSIGSATNRLSEAALRAGQPARAARLSDTALSVLEEGRAIADSEALRVLTGMALMQRAQIALRGRDYGAALQATESAFELFREAGTHATPMGEVSWYRAEALVGLGQVELALRELEGTVDLLFRSGTVESGVQALLLRARLRGRAGDRQAAYADLDRAVSVLRYQVFAGRIDLEPLLAYTGARRALTGAGSPDEQARSLEEFVEWGRQAIRLEGRSDLRALLAYLLLARGRCWKDAGAFPHAVEDLRAATEQYELLVSAVKRSEAEPVWNGLRAAFAQMTALYLSLDEAPLAILVGRRALELGQRASGENQLFESGLEVPTFPLLPPSGGEEEQGDQPFESELYPTARLYFHLGEATRRLNLEKFATVYFEQAALGFERLLTGTPEASAARLEEYRVVLKYVAKSAESHRDFSSLEHWLGKLSDLPASLLTDFDRYSLYSWKGACLAARGDLRGAQIEYRAGLESLEPLAEHPRYGSLRAETLLALGRVLSLGGQHAEALAYLEQASTVSQAAVFEEGEENRELLVRNTLHLAVAHLRAGERDIALEQLRILVSFRPLGGMPELEGLTDDWVAAWQQSERLPLPDLCLRLSQMCELGDWLLRTPLGLWFRELVTELTSHPGFAKMPWESERLDQVIETFLVVAFSQTAADNATPGFRGTSVSDTGELQRLLKSKYRALQREGRLVEAELALSHMLPARTSPTSGRLLLLRSEMALQRGDRGMGIVDLLRATEGRGKARVKAHLRLAEFLLSRDLQSATSLHLRRSLFSIDESYGDLAPMLERFGALMSGLVRAGAPLDSAILEEYLKVCRQAATPPESAPVLDSGWLRALGDYRDWPQLIDAALALLAHRQKQGGDRESDWRFLEEVLERTVLGAGRLGPVALKDLGKLLVLGGLRDEPASRAVREIVWRRFVGMLPALGRRDGFTLLQRLFEFASGREVASTEGRAAEFLARLEEEKRLLAQPT